jgi:hypothetical protein
MIKISTLVKADLSSTFIIQIENLTNHSNFNSEEKSWKKQEKYNLTKESEQKESFAKSSSSDKK